MPLETGSRLGRYEILASVGAGGMGEVYRARDPQLEREVALKVLPAGTLTDEVARARLLREARMAARLNHPHVCTVHEVGEAGGQVYIAMELVEGQPLDAVLARGPLPVERAVGYGTQIADALAHAHERGVVHRDLKSANVVITPEGRAKVLDFGLAKQLVGEELAEATTEYGATLTVPGSVVGTVAYMAPEQLKGQPADARSDVWALGIVLYEMLAGKRPFAGQTGYELSSAILNEPPSPLPDEVPSGVRAVVERCLAKEAGERFQTAREVREALEAIPAGSAIFGLDSRISGSGIRLRGGQRSEDGRTPSVRIAVLPFANLTGDPEQEYLSDGITQEMISQLGRLHPDGLSVIARSSVMRYKGGNTPIDQIGRELSVEYVLEGSARREADLVRITSELIQVGDQTLLWSETYERELAGILTVQSEVAREVAEALALELLPGERARLTSVPEVDPEAHQAYLKGSYHWKKATPVDLDTAERYFELALEKDPLYAPAYEGLSWVWAARQQMGVVSPVEAGPKAKAAALKAIELDDRSAEAHEALALVRTWIDWDWQGAEPEWRRALQLNPNAANAHAYYAHFLTIMGRIDEALQHSVCSLELDPFNALFHGLYAGVLYFQGRHDEAIDSAHRALSLQPDQPIAHSIIWYAAFLNAQYEAAVESAKAYMDATYLDHAPGEALDAGWKTGGHTEAMRCAAAALEARFETLYAIPADIAAFHVQAGQHDRAIEWLETAFQQRDPTMAYIGMPVFDPLRADPRFQDLLRRLNLPLPEN